MTLDFPVLGTGCTRGISDEIPPLAVSKTLIHRVSPSTRDLFVDRVLIWPPCGHPSLNFGSRRRIKYEFAGDGSFDMCGVTDGFDEVFHDARRAVTAFGGGGDDGCATIGEIWEGRWEVVGVDKVGHFVVV